MRLRSWTFTTEIAWPRFVKVDRAFVHKLLDSILIDFLEFLAEMQSVIRASTLGISFGRWPLVFKGILLNHLTIPMLVGRCAVALDCGGGVLEFLLFVLRDSYVQ